MAGPFPTTTTTTCAEKYTSVTLAAGEQFVLPPGATLVFADNPGAITSEDNCLEIGQLAQKICGRFETVVDSDDNPGHPMDENSTQVLEVTFENITIPFNQLIVASGDNDGNLVTLSVMNSYIPLNLQNLFKFTNITWNTSPVARSYVYMDFEVLDIFIDTLEMKCNNHETVFYLKPVNVGDCQAQD